MNNYDDGLLMINSSYCYYIRFCWYCIILLTLVQYSDLQHIVVRNT